MPFKLGTRISQKPENYDRTNNYNNGSGSNGNITNKPTSSNLLPSSQSTEIMEEKQAMPEVQTGLDLNKLARAVAMHETADCTKGSAKVNNCFGIKRGGKFVRYPTKEASYEDFKRIWSNPKGYYQGKFPNEYRASKYSGNDRPKIWLKNVTNFYYAL